MKAMPRWLSSDQPWGANSLKFGLSGRTCEIRSAWVVEVLRTRIASKIEMPTLLPMLRTRVNSPAASVRRRGSRVPNTTVDSGTKIKPTPKPWVMPAVTTSSGPICRVMWVIHHSE